jgi:hypothetical protein
MIYHYLDASAWVKRYSQEMGTVMKYPPSGTF